MTERPRDRYDQEVERLLAEPDFDFAISRAWNFPYEDVPGAFLFGYCSKDRKGSSEEGGCGCLTQIAGSMVGPTPTITNAIRSDTRIPDHYRQVTREQVPVFAEWHRRLDAELGRTPPRMLPE